MEQLKTIAIDVSETVFNNDTEGIIYITKDIYSDSYVIALPVFSFSWSISFANNERDYNDLLSINGIFGETGRKERLVQAIREGIAKLG